MSFRDAMMKSLPTKSQAKQETRLSSAEQKQRKKIKPRFVVTTTNAPATKQQRSVDSGSDSQDCDYDMEFYERKAHGHRGRVSGLKLRPDELKRKVFIVEKKERQRQKQRQQRR